MHHTLSLWVFCGMVLVNTFSNLVIQRTNMPQDKKKFMNATAELLLIERNEEMEARKRAEVRAEVAERKYEDLVRCVRPLLEAVQKMEEPAGKIEAVLAELRKTGG